jgi:molybdopterin synthase catalytic subunit
MVVRVQEEDFDVGVELMALRHADASIGARIGAIASFIGLVREMNDGNDGSDGASVSEMTLEYYPGMTEKALAAIVLEARQRWNIFDALLIHRVGRLLPNEQIVLVAVSGAHRAEAFAACEFMVDYLKTRAPFWKREVTSTGARWVDAREADVEAAARWNI